MPDLYHAGSSTRASLKFGLFTEVETGQASIAADRTGATRPIADPDGASSQALCASSDSINGIRCRLRPAL